MCGETTEHALAYLEELERLTAPDLASSAGVVGNGPIMELLAQELQEGP
jgi:hypothetical protein